MWNISTSNQHDSGGFPQSSLSLSAYRFSFSLSCLAEPDWLNSTSAPVLIIHTRPQFVFITAVVFQNHILWQIEIGRSGWGFGWRPFCFGLHATKLLHLACAFFHPLQEVLNSSRKTLHLNKTFSLIFGIKMLFFLETTGKICQLEMIFLVSCSFTGVMILYLFFLFFILFFRYK